MRGNMFNSIVKDTIVSLALCGDRYKICFEKQHKLYVTTEIPDWYIFEKSTNKIMIGMNQLDLISGGQQLNRGYKYIIETKHNTLTSILVCVICNHVQFKTANKKSKLFEIGFANNTLTYIKNLNNIIDVYFNK